MKANIIIAMLVSLSSFSALARDVRNESVLNSKMVKAIIKGLSDEQNLNCEVAIEGSGEESVAYFIEDNLKKFSAGFLCDDGRSAIIIGILGDGGQTKTESFRLIWAN